MIKLADIIEIKAGYIENAPLELQVDAIVNAACPTLMGSETNVDGAIHKKIDELNETAKVLKRRVKKEIDENEDAKDNIIRCQRGEAVITSGCNLCEFIIHTVGPESDAEKGKPSVCSSSKIKVLESCYRNIMKESIKQREIKKIAVPVISAGNYGVDFELALKVGIATLYNTLLEMKQKDEEYFNYLALRKIYFVIPNTNRNVETANKILEKFQKVFQEERRVVYQFSWNCQMAFLKDIILYDKARGYFAVARDLRIFIVVLRTFLFPLTYLKDFIGGYDWIKRRTFVEFFTLFKMLLPVIGYFVIKENGINGGTVVICGIMAYELVDTITYLLSLIILADIQNPSANTIRSMIMLIINYLEISLDISVIYYFAYYGQITFRQAMAYGLLDMDTGILVKTWIDYCILYFNQGTKFFFLTLAFAYFSNHLQQRKFRNVKE